jgi:hypothetical protein
MANHCQHTGGTRSTCSGAKAHERLQLWYDAARVVSQSAVLNIAQAVSLPTKDLCMLFMIIEHFKDNDMLPIYKRLRDDGRMLPDGLTYIDSWIEPNFSRCFQLMECDDLRLLQQWTLSWRGSGATFEIVPVVSSKDTREVVAPLLDSL